MVVRLGFATFPAARQARRIWQLESLLPFLLCWSAWFWMPCQSPQSQVRVICRNGLRIEVQLIGLHHESFPNRLTARLGITKTGYAKHYQFLSYYCNYIICSLTRKPSMYKTGGVYELVPDILWGVCKEPSDTGFFKLRGQSSSSVVSPAIKMHFSGH